MEGQQYASLVIVRCDVIAVTIKLFRLYHGSITHIYVQGFRPGRVQSMARHHGSHVSESCRESVRYIRHGEFTRVSLAVYKQMYHGK